MTSVREIFRKRSNILIYGIGNPSRQDDALGILFAEAMRDWAEAEGLANLSFDANYQLNIEDAFDISKVDAVIFADASKMLKYPFKLRRIRPSRMATFSTHSLEPESVLAVCEDLFGMKPHAFIMAIRGHSWKLSDKPSRNARKNLTKALDCLKKMLGQR